MLWQCSMSAELLRLVLYGAHDDHAGASALDKRSAKAWRASMLARLGATADRAPRTPARIGLGMAKKARQRAAVALQEAIDSGMVRSKGRGKKERAAKGAWVVIMAAAVCTALTYALQSA